MPVIPTTKIVLDEILMRAYCGDAIYDAVVRPTEEGVEEFRESVKVAMFSLQVDSTTHKVKSVTTNQLPVFVAIPGGKA